MVEIGKYCVLEVLRIVDFGVYMDGRELSSLLLPIRYVPEGTKIGDEIEVFIYLDSEDRLICTTEKPYATVDEFALLKAVDISEVGAFLDWGLPKDLFVPYRKQKTKMLEGESYFVRIYLDEVTDRIAASSKLGPYTETDTSCFSINQEVDIIITEKTDMGYNALINNTHMGLLYENEIFQDITLGETLKAFIKELRRDHKIDLYLQKNSHEKIPDLEKFILEKLKGNDGVLKLTFKTSADEIYSQFKVSKKLFKRAVSALYKKRLIAIEDDCIKLL